MQVNKGLLALGAAMIVAMLVTVAYLIGAQSRSAPSGDEPTSLNEETPSTPDAGIAQAAALGGGRQGDMATTLAPPLAADCDENVAFFGQLMKQGYERVVSGFGGRSDSLRDVAIWRAVSGEHSSQGDDDHLIPTVSSEDRACKIIGLFEMSAPAG